MLIASLLIVLVVGVQYYISKEQDEVNARKLVNRELIIVERHIMSRLDDAEDALDDMHEEAQRSVDNHVALKRIMHETMVENTFLRAAAIAFVPEYLGDEGKRSEYSTIRYDHNKLEDEHMISIEYDYASMGWYLNGIESKRHKGTWSMPYIDFEDDEYIITLSRPVYKDSVIVAVTCVDVELRWLKQILVDAEPYDGSVCTIKGKYDNIIVSSDNVVDFAEEDYFFDSKKLSVGDMVVTLACPKNAIYGDMRILNIVTMGLLIVGMLLLLFIVQRTVKSIIRLNNARQQQQVMDREMHIAHDIQMDILRRDFPQGLSAMLLPMKEVGGDLYDFCARDGNLYFIVGDVSGKGIPAAMVMASTVNLFRMASHHFSTPVEIMCEINHVLAERNPNMLFVTAFVGKLDMQHGLLTYCNAGHNPPLLGDTYLRTDPDIPLGYQPDYAYHQYGMFFEQGRQLVLYTDGITESRNETRKMMGTTRLADIVKRHSSKPVEQLMQDIMNDIHAYAGHTDQIDDMTLMCIVNMVEQQHPSLVITNDIDELGRVKALVKEYSDCLGVERSLMRKIMLSVEEATVNIINYSYPKGSFGMIDIDITGIRSTQDSEGEFSITMSDKGAPFDPTACEEVDVRENVEERQVGGLGIYLYQKLMDEACYERTADGRNVLKMIKKIPPIIL